MGKSKKLTEDQLRIVFEESYFANRNDLRWCGTPVRYEEGKYSSSSVQTLWNGYKDCAKQFGITKQPNT